MLLRTTVVYPTLRHLKTKVSASENEEVGESETFVSKDGNHTYTTRVPNLSGRRSRQNIVRETGGPSPHVNPRSMSQSLSYFLTDDILQDILVYTNREAEQRIHAGEVAPKIKIPWMPMSEEELRAFIGILYLDGVLRGSKQRLRDMWDKDFGINHVIAAMSRDRFLAILKFLRFDDRAERQPNDVFAPFRKLWKRFVEACRRNIIASEYLCVDEQLVPTRGRCPFRVYMGNKPHR